MLQAPSPLSRLCGHSHFKKFWLMQTQKEAQASLACEKNANLVKSSSRCLPSSPVRSPDPCCGSGSPSMRTLLREGPLASNPNSGCGSGKHSNLATCAESLTCCMQTESGYLSANQKPLSSIQDLNDNAEDSFLQTCSAERGKDTPVTDSLAMNVSRSIAPCSTESSRRQSDILIKGTPARKDTSAGLELVPEEFSNSVGHSIDILDADVVKSQGLLEASIEKCHVDSVGEPSKSSILRSLPFDECLDSKDIKIRSSASQGSIKSPGRAMMQSEVDRGQERNNLSDDSHYDRYEEDSEDGMLENGKLQDPSKLDSSGINSSLRTCSHCGTTKTPLWRSGPHGPKSLCNACGIRFKKSRRYMCSVSEGPYSPASPNASKSVMKSLKRKQETTVESHLAHSQEDAVLPPLQNVHKRSRWPARLSLKKDCLQRQACVQTAAGSCLTWTAHSLISETFFPECRFELDSRDQKWMKQQIHLAGMFARDDVEEAAVLLMALSCGLVNA